MSVNNIWNKSYMNCGNKMKMKKWLSQWTQFMQLWKKPEKKNSGLQRGLNLWPRNTGVMFYQLSYEATDIGSRSIVALYVPVKEMSVNVWNKSYYMNCGNEMKMKKWSPQWTQFRQLRKEAWKKKFRSSTGFEPLTSWYWCDALPTELWSLPLTLGAGQLWVHMFPWKNWVLMIYEINHKLYSTLVVLALIH